MALSDKKIIEERYSGNIIIEPFIRDQLATSSYDVTLGDWFFTEQRQSFEIYNIWNKNHTDKVWGTEAKQAGYARDILKDKDFEFIGINQDEKIILLAPGETILGHTQEFIGGKNHITTMMKARSSMGRNFIEVCKCAGWGDVGYTNRWTMEITNNSRFHSIPLVVGRRIAQIIFFETGEIEKSDYTKTGKYQSSPDIETLKAEWKPNMMLPKLYNDRDIKK